jgi:hemerythrin-like domain-containing protein
VPVSAATNAKKDGAKEETIESEGEVSATEDLMREHGVLRRTLIVYSELSERLRGSGGPVDPAALADLREFGEQYHERMLEEQYIFPEVRKVGGPNEKLVEVLLAQHRCGREITDYLYQISSSGQFSGQVESLSSALAGMARMYRAHAAWEDTIIFPAWKKTQSKQRLQDLAEKFEEIEHQEWRRSASISRSRFASTRGDCWSVLHVVWRMPSRMRLSRSIRLTSSIRRPMPMSLCSHLWHSIEPSRGSTTPWRP